MNNEEQRMKRIKEVSMFAIAAVALLGLVLVLGLVSGCDEPSTRSEPTPDHECVTGCEDYVAEYTICFGVGPWGDSKTTCESVCTWHYLDATWECMAGLQCWDWDAGPCWELSQ